MRSRSHKRRYKQVTRPQETEPKATDRSEAVSQDLGRAADVNLPLTDDTAGRAFWPELAPSREKEAVSTGRGFAFTSLADARLTIKAVSDGYPVPRAIVVRLVFDVWLQATDQNLRLVTRQRFQKLLVRMIERNMKPRKLPKQICVVSVREVLEYLDADSSDLDTRIHKIAIGSDEDYGE